jgi:heme/copper-type cytochrome/quinol oxidase subunit 1
MKLVGFIKKKPEFILWLLSSLLFLFSITSFYISGDSTLDINVQDTYIVISHFIILLVFSLWFALCGLGYWVLNKFGVRLFFWLTTIHLTISFFGILLFFMNIIFFGIQDIPKRYYENTSFTEGLDFAMLLTLLIGTQIFYVFNILLSTVSKHYRIKQ